MLGKGLVFLFTAATLMSVFSVLPADARSKKEKQYRVETPSHAAKPYRSGTISLDGRNTGRARTCGYDTFLYDELGVPTGPYCH